jgi:translocation and assembly module TamA
VRIFKIILLLSIGVHLFGQSINIVIEDIDTLTVNSYDGVSFKLDSLLRQSKNIEEYFKLSRINSDSLITYNKNANNVPLDTLIFKNTDEIRISVLTQIFRPLFGTVPTAQTTMIFNKIVNSTPFINNKSDLSFGINSKQKVGAVIDLKTNFNNYFSGLMGASRSEEQKWYINGQMDIHLENQWRTASIVDLHWKRLDEESQILNLKYDEPHPLGLPIGVSIAYNQDLRDGNYVGTNSSVGVIKTVPSVGKLGFGGKNTKINSTAKGDSLGLANLTTQSMYINGTIDYRNDYWLPTKGIFISLNSDIGKRVVNDSNSVSISGQTVFEKYFPILGKNNIAIKMIGSGKWVSSGTLHSGELIRYGGATSLRGYTEDSFKSNWVIIPSIEYNINLSSNQQLTLFSDTALQETYTPLPYGFGIGFTQVTKNSVLKLYYGLGREDSIKNGKIHLQFLTRL